MGKVTVVTVGCKVNQAESEELKMDLVEAGHSLCEDPAECDLCVVNTCTVTAESDRKCRKTIRGLHRRGARAIVAAGCYVQVEPGSQAVQGRYVLVWRKNAMGEWRALSEIRTPDPVVGEPVRLSRQY